MRHGKEPLAIRGTKGDPASFTDGMIGIRTRDCEGVGQHGARFLEGNPVLPEIRGGFAPIPCNTHLRGSDTE